MDNIYRRISESYNTEPEIFLKENWFKTTNDFFIWLGYQFKNVDLNWKEIWAGSPLPNELEKIINHFYMKEAYFLNDYVFDNVDSLSYYQKDLIYKNYMQIFRNSFTVFWSISIIQNASKYDFFNRESERQREININKMSLYKIEETKEKFEKIRKEIQKQIRILEKKYINSFKTENRKIELIEIEFETENYKIIENWHMIFKNQNARDTDSSKIDKIRIIASSDKNLTYYPDEYYNIPNELVWKIDKKLLEKILYKWNRVTKTKNNKYLLKFIREIKKNI